MSIDVRVQVPSLAPLLKEDSRKENRCARVVELADSLDSGSSAHYGRAGSSPASRTKETAERLFLFLFSKQLTCFTVGSIVRKNSEVRQ